MLVVEWLPSAVDDLEAITDYIALSSSMAAIDMEELFLSAAEKIPEQPYSGRYGREAGTREKIPHPRYVMVYRITHTTVEIVNVLHTSRLYPFE